MKTALRLLAACVALLGLLLGLPACEPVTVEPLSTGTLTVTVLDAASGQPLPNVNLTTNPASSSYVSDAQGKATLAQVTAGTVAVTARKSGYDVLTSSVTLGIGSQQTLSMLLQKTSSTTAPGAPTRPSPATGATDQPITLTLSWHPAVGTAKSDSLTYDVALYEGTTTNPRQVLAGSRDSTATVSNLRYGTSYFWQVTVRKPNASATLGPVWSFRTVAFPSNRYLFTRTVNGSTDIYSSDAAGSTVVRLTPGGAVYSSPQWSPQGDLIAYTSNASGQWQLYTMNPDGTNPRRITALSVEGYNNMGVGYRWSPDGGQLLYGHYDQLYRIGRDGTGLVQLATAPAGRHFRECDWTQQNGGALVVQTMGANVYDSELYLYDVNGNNPRQLVGNLPGRVDSPSFSVDGLSVAYSHDAAGFNDAGGRQLDCRVYLLPLATGATPVDVSGTATSAAATQGKPLGTNDLLPRFTPTGYGFIFVNRDNDDRTAPQVWTMSLSGTLRTKLFDNATQPDWK